MTINAQTLGAWFLRALAVAAAVVAAIPATDVPTSVRPALAIAGAIILAVDRYVTDPSTGTPTPAPPVADHVAS